MKPKLLIVTGPTGAGKSHLVSELAAELDGEIINADSQQVYRHMDIGTAKPSKEQRELIRHHVIDVVDPDEAFNVAMFRQLATESAGYIGQRGRRVLVCGGTGLYIKALTRGLFPVPAQDPALRATLNLAAEAHGLRGLYDQLQEVDPSAASWIHPNDRQRIVRALEVYQLTGKPISAWQEDHAFNDKPFETLKIGLWRDRAALYHRIDQRSDRMIEAGLIDEVKALADKGYSFELKPLQSVGYRQAGCFLQGQMTLPQALSVMKRETRRLAKRQLTWFRGDKEVRWFHPEAERDKIKRLAEEFLNS
ncbi:MAG: tRNA (adenosine(37)-N6)-dimethylallyltransferase MiaA [Candidatus Binatia bacterium]